MGLRGCLGESFGPYKQRWYAATPIAASAMQQVEKKQLYLHKNRYCCLMFNPFKTIS